MKNENGQEVVRRECDGTYVDAECEVMGCRNGEFACIIQELVQPTEASQG